MKPFLVPIIIAVALGILFHPWYCRLQGKIKKNNLSAVLMCLLVFVIFIVPLSLVLAGLVQQTTVVYENVGAGDLITCESGIFCDKINELQSNIDKQVIVENVGKFLYQHGRNFIFGLTNTIFGFAMMLLTLFFIFRDGHSALKYVSSIMPVEKKYRTKIISKFKEVSNSTIYGILMIAIAQGIVGGVIFWLFNVDAPIFWGFVTGFASLIPIVGTTIVWVPFGIFMLTTDPLWKGILFLLCGAFFIGGIDNILRPILMKRGTKMHTLLVFFSVLGGLDVFGFIGIFVGPLIMAMFLTILEIYRLKYA